MRARQREWRESIDVFLIDGFSGFKTAAPEQPSDAVEVSDPFHVFKLAGDALGEARRGFHQEYTGRPPQSGKAPVVSGAADPAYS
ncbi:transposase [Brevibacterium marinum]|uniref:transposase n=1 Tax=Brevibacterium marinum TaxID=418643 RepID=UPI003CC921B0